VWRAEADVLRCIRFTCFPLQKITDLTKVTVKMVTGTLLNQRQADRVARVQRFVREAGCADAHEARHATTKLLLKVWQLPWENSNKEVYWRLMQDGLAMYGASRCTADRQPLPCLCGCAGSSVSRMHHFWECSIAVAVRNQLQMGLASAAPAGGISRQQLWLMQQPAADMVDGAWHVIVLAALQAMEAGRRRLTALCMPQIEEEQQQQQQQRQHRVVASARHLAMSRVHAEEHFWSRINDFAWLNRNRPPRMWLKQHQEGKQLPFFLIYSNTVGDRENDEPRMIAAPRPRLPPVPDLPYDLS